MARTIGGLAAALRRLASYFRIAPLGYAEPETQQPARARLGTPEEVVAELRAERQLPTQPQWVWSYICYWYDPDLGPQRGRVGRGVAHTVVTEAGADYRSAAAEARRRTLDASNPIGQQYVQQFAGMKLTCRRIGQPLEINP